MGRTSENSHEKHAISGSNTRPRRSKIMNRSSYSFKLSSVFYVNFCSFFFYFIISYLGICVDSMFLLILMIFRNIQYSWIIGLKPYSRMPSEIYPFQLNFLTRFPNNLSKIERYALGIQVLEVKGQ